MRLNDGILSEIWSKTISCPTCHALRDRIKRADSGQSTYRKGGLKGVSVKSRRIPFGVLNQAVNSYAGHLKQIHNLNLKRS